MLWALTWAIGTAIGVAMGEWLGVVGAQGAPGVSSLDASWELFGMPLIAGACVFAVYLAAGFVLSAFRR
ncbi:MAG: hypothetical protein Q7V14_06080 [Coriobacteriia bacterium]|nr:hypothetical protein [Coriobacteriia bacterium]